MVVELTLTNCRVSGDHFTLVKKIFCSQCTTQFRDRLNYPSKIPFFQCLSFLQDFLLAQLRWVGRWRYLLCLSLLTEITTLAEVLKQKQVLAFLELTSAYENFSNSAVKGINSLQKVKLWINSRFSSKPESSFPVAYASTSCSSSL